MIPFLFSSAPSASVNTSDIMGVMSPVTSQFSVANITALLTAVLGITVVFAFLWWGVRWTIARIRGAAQSGSMGLGGRRRR